MTEARTEVQDTLQYERVIGGLLLILFQEKFIFSLKDSFVCCCHSHVPLDINFL
jgi:hypothetical protein